MLCNLYTIPHMAEIFLTWTVLVTVTVRACACTAFPRDLILKRRLITIYVYNNLFMSSMSSIFITQTQHKGTVPKLILLFSPKYCNIALAACQSDSLSYLVLQLLTWMAFHSKQLNCFADNTYLLVLGDWQNRPEWSTVGRSHWNILSEWS